MGVCVVGHVPKGIRYHLSIAPSVFNRYTILGGHVGVCGLIDHTRLVKHRLMGHLVNYYKMVAGGKACPNDKG